MLSSFRSRLTYANVMATIGVFLALGGTSVAAVSLKKNSVSSSQVKNSSLTGSDIKNSSLTTSDVKNKSLLAKDFKAGQLPAGSGGSNGSNGAKGLTGPQGPAGPQGTAGARGTAGATSAIVRTGTTTYTNVAGAESATAQCNPGERAVGGGYSASPSFSDDEFPVSQPSPQQNGAKPTGWFAVILSSGHTRQTLTAWAICAAP